MILIFHWMLLYIYHFQTRVHSPLLLLCFQGTEQVEMKKLNTSAVFLGR